VLTSDLPPPVSLICHGINKTRKTSGKFAAGFVDTGSNFAAGVVDSGVKIATGVIDTGGAP
jgi:hypothetical protein